MKIAMANSMKGPVNCSSCASHVAPGSRPAHVPEEHADHQEDISLRKRTSVAIASSTFRGKRSKPLHRRICEGDQLGRVGAGERFEELVRFRILDHAGRVRGVAHAGGLKGEKIVAVTPAHPELLQSVRETASVSGSLRLAS